MIKNKMNQLIEYLSPTLIISYFFIHNIFLVLIGITFSLYLININFFNNLIRSMKKNIVIIKSVIESKKNDKLTKASSMNNESNKDDKKLTLVETIEELGFIPSIDKDQEKNIA